MENTTKVILTIGLIILAVAYFNDPIKMKSDTGTQTTNTVKSMYSTINDQINLWRNPDGSTSYNTTSP